MPNVALLLKQEIIRLSRREIRSETRATRQASLQYRHDIAALKREIGSLKRQIVVLHRGNRSSAPADDSDGKKLRFVAKGLRSQRNRLGLSAADYGKLVGVGAQSVYNWEQGRTTPRMQQVAAIASLRGIGKREAAARLKKTAPGRGKKIRRQ